VPARNQAEFDRKYDLAEWIGLAYNNVAEAVQVAGDNLYPGRPAKARALLQRYRQLEGDDRMANDERALLAILDWTAERDSGQDPDDVTIARNEGLVSRSFVNPKAHWFFAQVGDFRRAVGALQHKSRNDDLLEGMYCDRMGDKARAIAAYQRYLHQRWTVNDSEGVAEARVGIAELTGPDAAKKLIANDGWEQGINLVTYQGLRFCPPRPFYLARLVWAAGDRDEALVMMKKFVQETAGNGPARYASAILASWEAETARRKKQTIHR